MSDQHFYFGLCLKQLVRLMKEVTFLTVQNVYFRGKRKNKDAARVIPVPLHRSSWAIWKGVLCLPSKLPVPLSSSSSFFLHRWQSRLALAHPSWHAICAVRCPSLLDCSCLWGGGNLFLESLQCPACFHCLYQDGLQPSLVRAAVGRKWEITAWNELCLHGAQTHLVASQLSHSGLSHLPPSRL